MAEIEIPKHFDAKEIESKWYKYWIDNKFFESRIDPSKNPFVMVLPPPNASGMLHLGHSVNTTYQDVIARIKRMQNYNVLFICGIDHGGLSTEYVVKQELSKKGLTKESLGKEKFIGEIEKWRDEKGHIIIDQLKSIGISCDWTREQYTMSPQASEWVRRAFVTLYKKDLIYQGPYIVNYCVKCQTPISDDEVVHIPNPTGQMYYIRYYFADDSTKYIVVGTTRPETIFGDVAIATNPEDERYKHLIGKKVLVPIISRQIPIIADSTVQIDKGSGMLKITPAHSKDDFEIGTRHNLEKIVIIDNYSKITNTKTKYDGQKIKECRKNILEELTSLNHLEKTESNVNSTATCYKCATEIEPQLSTQWFVRMKTLAEPAIAAVENGDIVLKPDHHEKIYYHWLRNVKDWTISRSIVWGHQIPIWYCQNCTHIICEMTDPTTCPKCASTKLKREESVLDTWFSSQLCPFTPFTTKEEMDYYYPTDLLVTGSDILFFWVARMIMASLEFTNQIPFSKVFLHGLVRDEKGEKMAKTKKNGIDPLKIINTHSADILRMTLMLLTPDGEDAMIGEKSFNIGKTFQTKLYNLVRYCMLNIKSRPNIDLKTYIPTLEDIWMINKLNAEIEFYDEQIEKFGFNKVIRRLYSFVRNEFCNCYLEVIKPNLSSESQQFMLLMMIDIILRMLHPYIPFITEELWQKIKPFFFSYTEIKTIMHVPWIKPILLENKENKENEKEQCLMFEKYWAIIELIRSKLTNKEKVIIHFDISKMDIKFLPYLLEKKDKLTGLISSESIEYTYSDKHKIPETFTSESTDFVNDGIRLFII